MTNGVHYGRRETVRGSGCNGRGEWAPRPPGGRGGRRATGGPPRPPDAAGTVGPRLVPRGDLRARAGHGAAQGPRSALGPRDDAGRADDHDAWLRGAEAAPPPPALQRPARMVTAVLRARRRVRPRRPAVPVRARPRRVGSDRPAGVR